MRIAAAYLLSSLAALAAPPPNFEAIRAAFIDLTGLRPAGGLYVVVEPAMEPGRRTIAHGDLIILRDTSQSSLLRGGHEYAHALMTRAGLDPPVWLSEGFAEYLSTAAPGSAGAPPPGRVETLLKGDWLEWNLLFAIDIASPLRNEAARTGHLYDQGWALTHMIIHSRDLKSRLKELLDDPAARLDLTDLDARFRRWLVPSPPPPDAINPAPPAVAVALDDALLHAIATGQPPLDGLARRTPDSAGIWAELGWLELNRGRRREARIDFEKASSLGTGSIEGLFQYAALLRENNEGAKAAPVLQQVLSMDPSHLDARLMLASEYLIERRPDRAVALLKAAPTPPHRRAAEYQRTLAEAMRATTTAREAKPAAPAKEQGVTLTMDDFPAKGAPAPPPAPPPPPREEPEPSRRPETYGPRETGTPPPPPLPSVEGNLIEVECHGSTAVLTLQTSAGVKKFVIDDGNKVTVDGPNELACGKDPPRPVRIQYERPNLVRRIEFK